MISPLVPCFPVLSAARSSAHLRTGGDWIDENDLPRTITVGATYRDTPPIPHIPLRRRGPFGVDPGETLSEDDDDERRSVTERVYGGECEWEQ